MKISKISKYAASGASAFLALNTLQADVVVNDIADITFEPTTIGESMNLDVDGDGINDITLFAYDPDFDNLFITLNGNEIAVVPTDEVLVYPGLMDVDFDCETGLTTSSGSIDRLGPGVSGFAPTIFRINGEDHMGVVELTTVAGTESQSDNVRQVIVHGYVYNDISIADGGCTVNAASLPVELENFNAYGIDDKVILDWSTLTEQNNEGFKIERSGNGNSWETIGFVSGNGTDFTKNDYTWIDLDPIAPQSYYRIKQLDYNGDQKYSGVISVRISKRKSNLELLAYPNPTTKYISYNMPGEKSQAHEVSLWSLEGKLIMKKQVIKEGIKTMDVEEIASGTYILNVKLGSSNLNKIVVKR